MYETSATETRVSQTSKVKYGSFYRPELDILRFVAFLLVFLCHSLPGDLSLYGRLLGPGILPELCIGMVHGGAYGVDLFFCLSSYLITTLLLREQGARKTIDVRSFYLRRVLRIWPLYFVYLLFIIPSLSVFLPAVGLPLPYVCGFLLLAGNWTVVAWGFPISPAGILWSVSIEEQFYLAWPMVMKRWSHRLVPICWGLLVLAFSMRVALVLTGASGDAIFCNTFARLDPIAAGALAAWFLRGRLPKLNSLVRVSLVLSGLLIIGTCGAIGSRSGILALVTFPAATLSSLLMLIGALGADVSLIPKWISTSLVHCGRISYGLYVFHTVAIDVSRVILPLHHPSFVRALEQLVIALVLTFLSASVSYRYLESPFLRLKERFTYITSRSLITG